MNSTTNLKAIVVASGSDFAKEIASTVAKAGFTLKGKMADSLALLAAELKKGDWDMLLVSNRLPEGVDFPLIVSMARQCSVTLPVVIVSQESDENIRYDALLAGASEAVSCKHAKLLGHIIGACLIKPVDEGDKISVVSIKQQASVAKIDPEEVLVTEPVDPATLSQEDARWFRRIIDALEKNRFSCVFQPVVNLNAQPASNYEILLRMLDDDGDEISPAIFIAIAERLGLMPAIDRWVIEHAIKKIKLRFPDDSSIRLFVKLSKFSLRDDKFIRWFSEQMHNANLPEYRLVFEITADTAAKYEQRAKTLVSAIKMNKCQICLDRVDNSERHQQLVVTLSVNYLKIAGHLIQDISNDRKKQLAVEHISNYAKDKTVLTIAQFVQDASSLAFLWQKGINYIQGYYLQRPEAALNYGFAQEEEIEVVIPSI